ncbi:MAG: LptE family protein [Candidatus Euphemobacter frigidus]|nr:LptE family protein [Candidatus Euphemobacter frigidus]MDP8276534.1 LptE family protein [Candidatus Euphemobacter frigidus]
MKQFVFSVRIWAIVSGIFLTTAGCGSYRLGTTLPPHLRTVYVPTFENKTYQTGLDVDLTDAVITRFRQDGNLRPVAEAEADTVLLGEITGWERRVLGYTGEDENVVEEYRLYIIVMITLKDRTSGEILISGQKIRGHTDFFVENSLPEEEEAARPKAYQDTARRIVDHVVSIW